MAYFAVADSGRDYDGDNGLRPPNGHSNSGNGEVRKELGSVEHASNVDSPDQVKDLVDIIEAAEVTIRTQVEETEQLRNSLRAVELELQKIDEQKHGAHEGYNSSQPFHGRNGSVHAPSALPQPYEYESGSAQHNGNINGGRYGRLKNGKIQNRSNGPSAAETGRSVSPQRRRHSEPEFRRDAYQGQLLPAELQDSNNPNRYPYSQDMIVRSSRTSEEEESNPGHLKNRLMEASVKEAQLVSEKRILERRVAEMRLAYDQQQQGLVDAASKALSYRQNVLEENIRLTYALQVAEQERTSYVENLMPLLAEFDLQPSVSDAHSIVSHMKILVQKLRSELEHYEVLNKTSKAKDPQLYPQSFQPSYHINQSYNPPTFHQSHGLEIVPSYSQRPASPGPQLRTGLPSWDPAPRYSGFRDHDRHLAGSNDQEPSADADAGVPHESLNGTPNEGLDDLRSDDLSYNGINPRGDPLFDRPDAVRSTSPQLPSLPEEPNSPSFEDIDPLPGIVGLRIVGDAVLGSRLTACGHSINGTSLCIFQWVRHYQDGTAAMIEGAAQPEYTMTADDCDSMVAIECVPMDERGRRLQGDLVTVMANDGNWISRDPMMQDQINSSVTNGYASFEVNLLIQQDTAEDIPEPATLVLRRSNFELRRNNSRKVIINEKYSPDVLIKIPCEELLQCVVSREDGSRENYLELRDSRTRDMAVLSFRAFHKSAMDEKKKTRRKWIRH